MCRIRKALYSSFFEVTHNSWRNLMWFDGPNEVEYMGPSNHMSFLCTAVFWWTQKPHVIWWTLKINKGPSNHMMFWVHQNTWGFSHVVGPSKHMRFLEGKALKTLIRVHQTTWGFGSIKTHEVLRGENFENPYKGPSNHMRFWVHQNKWGFERGKTWFGSTKSHEVFGSIKSHEVVKNWQNLVGSIKSHECQLLHTFVIYIK